MKRKTTLAPRNRHAVASKFRKAGAHGKAFKAKRRADKIETQGAAGRVARHQAFTLAEDGFESLAAHHKKHNSMQPVTGNMLLCFSIPRNAPWRATGLLIRVSLVRAQDVEPYNQCIT